MSSRIIGRALFALFAWGSGSSARAAFCLQPNLYVALAAPGGLEALGGFTAGTAHVNPDQACAGLMADVGGNLNGAKAALGLRTFIRYDWPAAMQINGFAYRDYDGAAERGRCGGLEVGFGSLMTMLRLHAGECADHSKLFGATFGFFY